MAYDKRLLVFSLVAGLVYSVSADTTWMKKILGDHFSDTRHHVANANYKEQAKTFVHDQFKSYGFDTRLHSFDTVLSDLEGSNVIGISKGEFFNTDQDVVYGIGAHYDTVRTTKGVNDNGAGVVIMLEAAKQLAKSKRNYTLVFVSFDLEESESLSNPRVACINALCGSKAFLDTGIGQIWDKVPQMGGFFILDTPMNINQTDNTQRMPLGFNVVFPDLVSIVESDGKEGDFLTSIGRPYDEKLMNTFNETYMALGQAQYEILNVNIKTMNGSTLTPEQTSNYGNLLRSDHRRFWEKGYPAIFLTDTADFRGYMERCYHKECDDMSHATDERMNFIGKTAQALVGSLNKLAPSLPAPPDGSPAPPDGSPAPPDGSGAGYLLCAPFSLLLLISNVNFLL